MEKLRPIAIHLPQFHPIPENDEWWGRGFTEWRNVAKARPLFPGHYQPHLPADLGFYDLRLEESRIAQAELAAEYGIYGFCYYHYWFDGKRLLERPVNQILSTGKPDFPFMLCWANENWSRRWDGSEDLILIKQNYSREDARAHSKELLRHFRDERYIRIDGKPVFAIYRPDLIDGLGSYVEIIRETAMLEGMELYLCAFESFSRLEVNVLNRYFDASVEFAPHSQYLAAYMEENFNRRIHQRWQARVQSKIYTALGAKKTREDWLHRERFYLDYEAYVTDMLRNYKYPVEYKRFPGVCPMWDNTARRGKKAFMLQNSTPEKYKEWLSYHAHNFSPYSKNENLVFINAWNEWAEGNHLEPCLKWDRAYLEATRDALL